MKKLYALALAAMVAAGANALDRTDLLFPIGSATPWGWSTDDASAISETSPGVYSGILYLVADEEMKFLCQDDWGNMYGPAENGAKPDADGNITMAFYEDGTPDNKMMVAESANYLITIDTEALTGKFVKADYQDSEVTLCSLFMLGSATPGAWSVADGTLMVQNPESPMTFEAKNVALTEGSFKIFTAMRGAGSFMGKYFYFADPTDENKMILNSDSDDQWTITEAGEYDVTANVADLTISITKSMGAGIENVAAETSTIAPVYYNLSGVRVAQPAAGQLLIRVDGNGARKVAF